jgi:hypothetical protein
VNATLLTVAIIGLWAGAVYEPTASRRSRGRRGCRRRRSANGVPGRGRALHRRDPLPLSADARGRWLDGARSRFAGMMVTIPLAFGWALYKNDGGAVRRHSFSWASPAAALRSASGCGAVRHARPRDSFAFDAGWPLHRSGVNFALAAAVSARWIVGIRWP